MGAIYFVALPWAVNASLRFSLRMTSYRNVRFNFKGSYWGAMKTFILFPILGLIPFYLGLPWVNKKVDEYLMNNAYYGEKQFKIDIQTKTYYKAVGASLLVVFGTAISAGLLAYIISLAIEGAEPFLMIIFAGLLTASYLFGFSAYKVIVRNHIFNNLQIPGVATFKSDLQYRDFTHMFMKNLLYTVLTLGLYLPWAIVHYLQLLADATSVELQPEIATVNDTAKNEESAIADEAADLFDLDIALG